MAQIEKELIDNMNMYINLNGYDTFVEDVFAGKFEEAVDAYIHPDDEMRKTENFKQIQRAFINAYV